MLRQVLADSSRLLGVAAGSVSLVREGGSRYAKVAELGAACQLGRDFSLDEGITGQVVMRRRPVALRSYRSVRAGHLPATHPAHRGAVVAVPIWWRGEVVGANVAFACRDRRFTSAEVDDLETLTQVAAAGIVRASAEDPSLARVLTDQVDREALQGGVRTSITQVGTARQATPAVTDLVLAVVRSAQRWTSHSDGARQLNVAVVYEAEMLRLLVHVEDNPQATGAGLDPLRVVDPFTRSWPELVSRTGGELTVDEVPGWGTLVRVEMPYAQTSTTHAQSSGRNPGEASPFTPREHEVLVLLRQGLTDRDVAAALVVSPRTVEKHVSALLRKTSTAGRTAAVMHAVEHGWLPAIGPYL
jgi:DNA-binding CsgD family transcriptional regulator